MQSPQSLAAHDVPTKLRQAIRVFCVQGRGAHGVYALRRLGSEMDLAPVAGRDEVNLWSGAG